MSNQMISDVVLNSGYNDIIILSTLKECFVEFNKTIKTNKVFVIKNTIFICSDKCIFWLKFIGDILKKGVINIHNVNDISQYCVDVCNNKTSVIYISSNGNVFTFYYSYIDNVYIPVTIKDSEKQLVEQDNKYVNYISTYWKSRNISVKYIPLESRLIIDSSCLSNYYNYYSNDYYYKIYTNLCGVKHFALFRDKYIICINNLGYLHIVSINEYICANIIM